MLSRTLNSPPKLGGVPSKRGRWYSSCSTNTPSATLVPLNEGDNMRVGQLLYYCLIFCLARCTTPMKSAILRFFYWRKFINRLATFRSTPEGAKVNGAVKREQ